MYNFRVLNVLGLCSIDKCICKIMCRLSTVFIKAIKTQYMCIKVMLC